jgi:hypothetical protein
MPPQRGLLRIGLVVLLVVGALFDALPWLGCLTRVRPDLILSLPFGVCTATIWPKLPTDGISIPGFTGPYFGNLILGIVYLVVAVYVTFRMRL